MRTFSAVTALSPGTDKESPEPSLTALFSQLHENMEMQNTITIVRV